MEVIYRLFINRVLSHDGHVMLTRIIDVGSEVNVTPCSCTRLVCSSLLSERRERGGGGGEGGVAYKHTGTDYIAD